jgi:phosphoheptose isomerase
MTKSLIESRTNDLVQVLELFRSTCAEDLVKVGSELISMFESGKKLLICGNGGSAADAQHFAAEFINAFSKTIHRRALPAIALTTDSSVITAIANDFSFDNIFSRQVEAIGEAGDVLVVLTTSGSSVNCIKALETGREIGMKTISITSMNAEVSKISDLSICVPSSNTQLIQACHLHTYHLLTEIVESRMFGEK